MRSSKTLHWLHPFAKFRMSEPTPIQNVFAKVHSPEGLPFPHTVAALLALGVTRYHVDYVERTATTYKPDGTTEGYEIEHAAIPSPAIPCRTAWNKDAVVKAIQRVQRGETKYAEFSRECIDAGVAGYLSFLAGKRVLYYGGQGDVHTEYFPGTGPTREESKEPGS